MFPSQPGRALAQMANPGHDGPRPASQTPGVVQNAALMRAMNGAPNARNSEAWLRRLKMMAAMGQPLPNGMTINQLSMLLGQV